MSHIEQFWRDATAADVARVMAGETVEARFRDCHSNKWEFRALAGWYRSSKLDSLIWAAIGHMFYRYCQVYAPPQWFLDKPDPGEEYRLLKKFPDEDLQVGDEFARNKRWWPVFLGNPYPQAEGIWYRRRIEQPKPEPKHYVLQVGDTVSTPIGRQAIVTEIGIEVS